MNKVINIAAFLLLITAVKAFSANCNSKSGTSGSPSDWNTTGTWTCGAVPTNNDNVNITHYLTSSTSLSFQWGSGTITISSTGNVTVNGNLDIYGSSQNLVIDGGTLTVTGTLTISGGGSITVKNGGKVTAGNLVFDNGNTASLASATINVTNTLTVNGSAITTGSATNITAGALNVTSSGGGSLTNGGTISVTNDLTVNNAVTNNGTFNVGGNYIGGGSGSSAFVNNKTFNLTGNMTLPSSSTFSVNPGGVSTVSGNVTTSANQNLIVGTNAGGPPYADMIIKKNLISSGSGDVLVDKNGRLAVFGNISSDSSGGSILTFNKGAQVYVGGTSTFTGGGDHITNNNTTSGSPSYIGFYTNSTPTYTGGGSGTTGTAPANTTTMKTDDPTFYAWVSGLSGSPLPVTLTSFEVDQVTENGIQLSWATASELNFDHFIVEKSADGITFTTATTVQGHGTTSIAHQYQWEDSNPFVGKNYYRLTSVDFDGKTESFSIVYALFEGKKNFAISPNPTDGDQITAWVNVPASDESYVTIFDNTGSMVARFAASSSKTDLVFSNPLKSGVYYAKYISTNYSEVIRFVVR